MTIKEFLDAINAKRFYFRAATVNDWLTFMDSDGKRIDAQIVPFGEKGEAGLSYLRKIRSSPAEYAPHKRLATEADIKNFFSVVETVEDLNRHAEPPASVVLVGES